MFIYNLSIQLLEKHCNDTWYSPELKKRKDFVKVVQLLIYDTYLVVFSIGDEI